MKKTIHQNEIPELFSGSFSPVPFSPRRPRRDKDSYPHVGRDYAFLRYALLLFAVLLASTGCRGGSEEALDATYGRRRGNSGRDSVNGTGVLAKMFENAGHTVNSWKSLSPRIKRYDVIVWAPDNFGPPSRRAQRYLNDWLLEGQNRTLIYIGRDYDAEIAYWNLQRTGAPSEQAIEIQRRLVRAKSRVANERPDSTSGDNCDWFHFDEDRTRQPPDSLFGPWSEGVDYSKTEIDVRRSLQPKDLDTDSGQSFREWSEASEWGDYDDGEYYEDYYYDSEYYEWYWEPLLHSEDDVFAFRTGQEYWNGSSVIVVTNGSFLLNLPLVNHEHRKIAGHLLDEAPPNARVLFIESGPRGIAVRNSDANSQQKGWEAFTVWPLSILMLHASVLGILFCLAVFPIFGRPREMLSGIVVRVRGRKIESTVLDENDPEGEPMASSNFAIHIDALGKLMARSGNTDYARRQVQQYHQSSKRDSGASHREDPSGKS